MSIQTFSSREFTRDVAAAKQAANVSTVFITDRGKPAFALLNIDDYYRIVGEKAGSLLDVMDSIPSANNVEFNAPRLNMRLSNPRFK
jgi:hypothetical protein